MAPPQRTSRSDGRPRARTPAERAHEAADIQRRLKREAAERRDAAAAAGLRSADGDGVSPGVRPRGGHQS